MNLVAVCQWYFLVLKVHENVRNAKKNLMSRQVITDNYLQDDLPGGVWKVSKTRDVSAHKLLFQLICTKTGLDLC